MSTERRHTDVTELGWLDWLAACALDPIVRVEGKDFEKTKAKGKLVRFNRACLVLPETATNATGLLYDRPRVHAEGLRRLPTGELVPNGNRFEVRWEELDWVSWEPWLDPAGRRAKVTVSGQSSFGTLRVYEDGRLVDTITRKMSHHGTYHAAVLAAMKRGSYGANE